MNNNDTATKENREQKRILDWLRTKAQSFALLDSDLPKPADDALWHSQFVSADIYSAFAVLPVDSCSD